MSWDEELGRARAGAANDVISLLVQVGLHHPDFSWSLGAAIEFRDHPDPHVRGDVVLVMGHLARRFGRVDPAARAMVRRALQDPHPFIRGQAFAAMDDIETFAPAVRRLRVDVTALGDDGGVTDLVPEATEFLLYTAPNGEVRVHVLLRDETVWLPRRAWRSCSRSVCRR